MADKIPALGEFSIPAELIDKHEWMTDALIDDVPGLNCTLIFPQKQSPCDNCVLDPTTGRSTGIYLSGGPISFANFQICPRCNGNGHLAQHTTATIRLRVYWETKSWIDIGMKIADPDNTVMLIGYMTDKAALERADKIEIEDYVYTRLGEAIPWGLRRNRFFLQYATRSN